MIYLAFSASRLLLRREHLRTALENFGKTTPFFGMAPPILRGTTPILHLTHPHHTPCFQPECLCSLHHRLLLWHPNFNKPQRSKLTRSRRELFPATILNKMNLSVIIIIYFDFEKLFSIKKFKLQDA